MNLFYKEYGEAGKPQLIVIHGLLGSSRNWQAAAKDLSADFHVFCLDMRNHGQSPHAEPHSFEAMADDVLQWMDEHGVAMASIIGHSMGGKVAMKLTCENPERFDKLLVVDIAPKQYPNSHVGEYDAMRQVDGPNVKTRTDAVDIMENAGIKDWAMRQFLITNLERDTASGGYRWAINIDAIEAGQSEIEDTSLREDQYFDGPCLFALGGRSDYFEVGSDEELVEPHFPMAEYAVIEESGHNPHFECRPRFVEIAKAFLLGHRG